MADYIERMKVREILMECGDFDAQATNYVLHDIDQLPSIAVPAQGQIIDIAELERSLQAILNTDSIGSAWAYARGLLSVVKRRSAAVPAEGRPAKLAQNYDDQIVQLLREMATDFALDNKTDCKQHICWIAADRLAASQSPAASGIQEVLQMVQDRLADLRKANEDFRKTDWRSSDIQRNDREIRLLIDINTLLRSPSQPGNDEVAIPKAALDWLHGAAPDHEGKWFGESEDAATPNMGIFPRPKYWWRSRFCDVIDGFQALSPRKSLEEPRG